MFDVFSPNLIDFSKGSRHQLQVNFLKNKMAAHWQCSIRQWFLIRMLFRTRHVEMPWSIPEYSDSLMPGGKNPGMNILNVHKVILLIILIILSTDNIKNSFSTLKQ